jgi:UDP-hydrolysing UDP-N-acetyl-D-glucosamine 2-epimerase
MVLFAAGKHILNPLEVPSIDARELDGARVGPLIPPGASAEISPVWLGQFTEWFAEALHAESPDWLLVIGDRYELLPAAAVALAQGIPIAHVSGGDITSGAIDDRVRYALTMLASAHFVAVEEHASRLAALGEDRSRITVVGEPALTDLPRGASLSRECLFRTLDLNPTNRLCMVSYHPPTVDRSQVGPEIESICTALLDFDGAIIATGANGDPGSDLINDRLRNLVKDHPNASFRETLGVDLYYEVMIHAALMVGNSSSGIWESASFGIPVINVGSRQLGRTRGANVCDSGPNPAEIRNLIEKTEGDEFLALCRRLNNPYEIGDSARLILSSLAELGKGHRLVRRDFRMRDEIRRLDLQEGE